MKYLKKSVKQMASLYQATMKLYRLKEEQPYYRMIKHPNQNDIHVHFQVIGKNIILKALPEKIMRDNLLLGFSKADIAIITHLGTRNECPLNISSTPSNIPRIIKQIFSEEKVCFLVENNSGEVSEYEASELYENEAMIKQFNGIDGMRIGYSVAEKHYKKIDALKNARK